MINFSHPDIPLIQHIENIIEYNKYLDDIGMDISLLSYAHDEGKKNVAFDYRIKNNSKKKSWDNHAKLSAIIYLIKELYNKEPSKINSEEMMNIYINTTIILGHHGSILSPSDIRGRIKYWQETGRYNTIQLLKAYNDKDSPVYNEVMKLANDLECEDSQPFKQYIKFFSKFPKDKWTYEHAMKLRLMFARFVDCDRLSAATNSKLNKEAIKIHELVQGDNNVENHIKKLDERTGYFKELEEQVKEQMHKWRECPKEGIYLLSLPTGLGKTLTSLQLAEWWRKKIIYASPFLSVTDQTEKVVRDIYKAKIGDKRITIHHSMAQIAEENKKEDKNNEDDDIEAQEEEISPWTMMERWSGAFVVTTVVELFETLMSNRGTRLRKLSNMYDVTILVDEPQTIEHQRWHTIKELLPKWCKMYKWRVILLSATPPSLPNNTIDMIRVDETKLKRTKLKLLEDVDEHEWVDKAWSLTKDKQSILWIVNTKKRANEFYQYILENIECENTYLIHSDFSKLQRTVILNNIKNKIDKKEKVLVISTQVLEAGVDLDFHAVVRELAPLPTLIQVAGRLNRKASRPTEVAYILPIKGCDGNSVYSEQEMKLTRKIVDEEIFECDYRIKCDTYYNELKIYKDDTYLNNYLYIHKNKFKMIEDKEEYNKVQAVLIHEETEELKQAWKELTGIEYIKSDDIIYELIKAIKEKSYEGIKKWKRYLNLYMGKINNDNKWVVTVNGKIVCFKEIEKFL